MLLFVLYMLCSVFVDVDIAICSCVHTSCLTLVLIVSHT